MLSEEPVPVLPHLPKSVKMNGEGTDSDPAGDAWSFVEMAKGVEHISPAAVLEQYQRGGCVLVDVRSADRASGKIPFATHVPAIDMQAPFPARIPELVRKFRAEKLIVFFCQYSRHRGPYCANLYRGSADPEQRVAVLDGGFRLWKKLGLPVVMDQAGPLSDSKTADAFALQQGTALLQAIMVASPRRTKG